MSLVNNRGQISTDATLLPRRVLYVNSGILGHASVAQTLEKAAKADQTYESTHINLSANLTVSDRVLRRIICGGPAPASVAGALTLARLRHELNAGLLAARRIAAAERSSGPFDIVHFHTQATAYGSLRRMRHTPAIVSIDATQRLGASIAISGLPRWEHAPNAIVDRMIFRAAAAIVSTSRWAADDVCRDQPQLATRVHVLPWPVPLDGFDVNWAAERSARPSRKHVNVLFIGGDWSRKGGPLLLEAWRAGEFGTSARLDIVSDLALPSIAEMERVTVHRGVRSFTQEWYELWRDADIFVMPTRSEAFGVVFQEAAAAALPAIGTNVGAVPEIIQDGSTGLIIERDDLRALVNSLTLLISDRQRRAQMGIAARARIEQVASVAGYSANLSKIIHEAFRAHATRRAEPM
jgi:glycosyltransferase involved in cell wall biosynthesis